MNDWRARIQQLGPASKVALALGVVLLIALVVLGGIYALGTLFFYDSYSSSYEYDVSISIDGETEDAVFIVPIGVHDGEAHLGDVHFSESDRFDGIDYTVADTEHGPMLRIEVDEIREAPDWHHLEFTAQVESDRTIDTRSPRGTEPLLSPVERFVRDLDEPHHDRWPDYRNFDATSTAYIEHDGDEDVEIGVSVWYRGGNDWWTFGWNGNWYETAVLANEAAHDPNGVWIELTGWHTEGAGSYPTFPPAPS